MRVSLHVPLDGGGFLAVRKFPMHLQNTVEPEDGTHDVVFLRRDGKECLLTRAAVDGKLRYSEPVEQPRELLTNADHSRTLLTADHNLRSYDTASGRQVADLELPGESWKRKCQPLDDGRVAVIEGPEVRFMDGDLHEQSRRTFPWDVSRVRSVPQGGLVVHGPSSFYELGNIRIESADGREVFTSKQVRERSVHVAPDGGVRLLEYSGDGSHRTDMVRVDASKGEIGRVEVPVMGSLFVRPDDSSFVIDPDVYGKPVVAQYGPQGEAWGRWQFEGQGGIRNVQLDEKRGTAYVVLSQCVGNQYETHLYQLKLHSDEPAKLIQHANENLVVLPVLDDGRLIVGDSQGLHVRSLDGSVRDLKTLQELRAAVGASSGPLGTNLIAGDRPYSENATLEAWLSVLARNLALPDSQQFAHRAQPGVPRAAADRTMEFASQVDAATAMHDMHLDEAGAYQRLSMAQPDVREAVDVKARDVLFPDGKASMQADSKHITVRVPGREDASYSFTEIDTALPVQAGDQYFVALADKAAAGLFDAQTQTCPSFYVGSQVTGLYSSDDAIYAVGSNGAVLMMEPTTNGKPLESMVEVPEQADQKTSGGRIERDGDDVIIGGVRVKRNPGAKEG